MDRQIVIFGASGHGRVVLDILRSSQVKVFGFLDSDSKKHGKKVDGIEILGDITCVSKLIKQGNLIFVVAIGDNVARKNFYLKIKKLGGSIGNAIHSSAIIAKQVKLGEGIVIASGVIICTNNQIGDNVIINSGAIVEHDGIIGKHVHVAPGVTLAGGVRIKDGAFIGIGSTIIQYKTIGKNVLIGAGSVIIDNIPNNVTVVGVPGKIIKNRRRSK
ncbi:acetyltransferase [candidate division KSB1 bacterium]|nr:acetyltransferase [candidate division KSB1 bacterium]